MAIQPGVWGIDLGQCGLKALRLEERDGTLVATHFDYIEHPKILSQPDADPDQLTREALEKFLSRNQLRGDIVGIGVPGQSGLARFVKLPPVEEKKIEDIVKFEAKQQIPFNLEEVVWDYQKLGASMVTDGFSMDTEIGLFAMKRDQVNRSIQQFRDVNVDIHLIQMAPLALCNFLAFDMLKRGRVTDETAAAEPKKKCVVGLDVGTDGSNLVVTDGSRIIWQRPIPIGGNHFTRALTKELKLTFAKAEHVKRNAAKSPDLKRILTALKPVLNDFVGEVQRSLGYFTNTHRDAEIMFMVGLGNAFRLPGLQRYMSEKLNLKVKKLDEMQRLEGDTVTNSPEFKENILTFGVCYGLALQGLEQTRLMTNLLPDEIRIERLVRGKKPWAVAAAAVILLGMTMLLFGYGVEWNAYGNESVTKAQDNGKKMIDAVIAAENKFNTTKSEADDEAKTVAAIASGQEERMNWVRLQHFIGAVIPRPDDVVGPALKAKWEQGMEVDPRQYVNGTGEWRNAAYDWMHHRLPFKAKDYIANAIDSLKIWRSRQVGGAVPVGGGDKGAQNDELAGVDGLMQFNIVGMNALYSDDLSAFWAELPENVRSEAQRQVRPLADLANPPQKGEKGWVVELRGYTFNRGKTAFILDVLVEKLAQAGQRSPVPLLGGGSTVLSSAVTGETWLLPKMGTLKAETGDASSGFGGGNEFGGGGGFDTPAATETKPKMAALFPRPISHVMLFNKIERQTSNTTEFEIADKSVLPTYVKSAAKPAAASGGTPSGMGGGMGGGMPGVGEMSAGGTPGSGGGAAAGTDPRASWQPLVGGTTQQGSGGAGGITPPGLSGLPGTPPGLDTGVGAGTPSTPSSSSGGTNRTLKDDPNSPHNRMEFIILFIWREPTPSDGTFQKASSGGASAGGGFGGGSFAPPGGGY